MQAVKVLPAPVAIWISARGSVRAPASVRGRHGVDLAVAQAVGDERRHVLQPRPQGDRLASASARSVSGRWKANTRRERGSGSAWSRNRVSVPEATYSNRTWPRIAPGCSGTLADIARGLVRETRERRAFRLRLDHAAERPADEQGVVDRTGGGRELAHRDAEPAPRFISSRDWTSQPHASQRPSIADRALSSG